MSRTWNDHQFYVNTLTIQRYQPALGMCFNASFPQCNGTVASNSPHINITGNCSLPTSWCQGIVLTMESSGFPNQTHLYHKREPNHAI